MIWSEVKPSYQPTRLRNFPPTAATAGILRVPQIEKNICMYLAT